MRPLTNKGNNFPNYQGYLAAHDPVRIQQAATYAYLGVLLAQVPPDPAVTQVNANTRSITVARLLQAVVQKKEDIWNATALAPVQLTPAVATFLYNKLIVGDANNPAYYRQVKNELTQAIGEYCSYCEMYIAETDLDVEHKLAKADFPMRALTDINFLLGCGKCNGAPAKGERPNRAFGIQRLLTQFNFAPFEAATNVSPNNPVTALPYTHANIQDAASNYSLWPDMNAQTLYLYRYVLRYINPLNGTVTNFANLATTVDQLNQCLYETNNLPFAAINVPGLGIQNFNVKVEIERATTPPPPFPRTDFAAHYTLMITRLNDDLTPVGGFASHDRRIFCRSKAWLDANAHLWHINRITTMLNNALQQIQALINVGVAPNPALALDLIQVTQQAFHFAVGTVEDCGHYSVWLTVWNRVNVGAATQLLTELQNRAANPGKRHMLGTDLVNTVLPILPQL